MNETAWLVVGFTGQACFFLRFLVQWISSERQKRSVIPVAFWYFSLAGATIVLIYAIYRRDPVFIVGQTTGFFIYLRNLYFIRKEDGKEEDGSAPGQSDQGADSAAATDSASSH